MSQELVNAQTGEISEVEQSWDGFPAPQSQQDKIEQFNAMNSASSLNDIAPGSVVEIKGLKVTGGLRKNRTTGIMEPCKNTYLLGADGKGYFSQSAGIAKSACFILMSFGGPENWGGTLKVRVDAQDLKNGNTLKSLVLV